MANAWRFQVDSLDPMLFRVPGTARRKAGRRTARCAPASLAASPDFSAVGRLGRKERTGSGLLVAVALPLAPSRQALNR